MSDRTSTAAFKNMRKAILAESDICWLCAKPGANSVDHVIPYSKGGSDERSNLKPAHLLCNQKRGNKDVGEVDVRKTSFDW